MGKNTSEFVVLRRGPDRRWLLRGVLATVWALSLVATWAVAGRTMAPQLPEIRVAMEQAQQKLQTTRSRLDQTRQHQATLKQSDQISRSANRSLQTELAARADEIAGLRSNLAFYERLAGADGPRKGLAVHSANFVLEQGGSWRYRITLTQSLERGAVSRGRLRFAVEGVSDGKMVTLDWDTLHQKPTAAAQPYAFRYFQRLGGSVMLPDGFTPQRVRVSLRGENTSLDQAVAWQLPPTHKDT